METFITGAIFAAGILAGIIAVFIALWVAAWAAVVLGWAGCFVVAAFLLLGEWLREKW